MRPDGPEISRAGQGAEGAGASSVMGARPILIFLILANLLSYFDRQFLLIVIEPLQRDLGFSDTRVGLLSGFSFALCYAVIGLPLSALVDRFNRVRIVAASILVWSAGTVACGLSSDFWQLFVSRMIVGVGEAGLAPAAYSLIGSYFARLDVPRASGFYAVGAALGTGLAIAGGGALLSLIGQWPLPFGLRDWQAGFMIVGSMGVPLSIYALLRLSDKRPTAVAAGRDDPREGVIDYLWRHRALYGPLLICSCAYMAFLSGFLAWTPTLFTRRYRWSLAETGARYGVMFLIFNVISGPLSGVIAARMARRTGRDQTLAICVVSMALMLAVVLLGALIASPGAALGLLGMAPLFSGIVGSLVPALIVVFTPPHLRGRVIAVFLFCTMVIGYGSGPLLYGWFTEHVVGDRSAVHLSLAMITPILLGVAIAMLLRARTVARAAVS